MVVRCLFRDTKSSTCVSTPCCKSAYFECLLFIRALEFVLLELGFDRFFAPVILHTSASSFHTLPQNRCLAGFREVHFRLFVRNHSVNRKFCKRMIRGCRYLPIPEVFSRGLFCGDHRQMLKTGTHEYNHYTNTRQPAVLLNINAIASKHTRSHWQSPLSSPLGGKRSRRSHLLLPALAARITADILVRVTIGFARVAYV